MTFFTGAARKAQLAAIIAFLSPIGSYIAAEGVWSWRAFASAVVSGVIAGVSVYYATNAPLPPVPRLRNRRHNQEDDSQ